MLIVAQRLHSDFTKALTPNRTRTQIELLTGCEVSPSSYTIPAAQYLYAPPPAQSSLARSLTRTPPLYKPGAIFIRPAPILDGIVVQSPAAGTLCICTTFEIVIMQINACLQPGQSLLTSSMASAVHMQYNAGLVTGGS